MSQNAGHRELGHKNKDVVVFKEEQQQHYSPTDVHERLTALGIAPATADGLIADHPGDVIDEAIDAADTAKPRNPAGWIIAALRGRWDTTDLATATKTTRSAAERRRQEDATRQQAGKTAERDRQRVDGWLRAVSAALNDDQLAQALRRVTTDVPGLQRRSLPVARTQLLRWAIRLHSPSDPSQPFTEALRTALPTAQPPHIDDDIERLPEPPDTQQPHQPLDSRFAACFHDMTTTAVGQT
ncbi:MAG TPA: hypothetical protein VJ978_05890 [Nitriliruptoraceae bacterium]|nr:hypothetical protein [Nitriliruptoraceae bacterium]